jgi:FMN phosphatase YigB (HAD superfamily)
MIKYLLVDCDGVLHDNRERLERQAMAIQKYYGNKSREEILDGYFTVHQEIHDHDLASHDNLAKHFARLGKKFEINFKPADAAEQARLWQQAYDVYNDNPKIYDDVPEFLAQAMDLGLQLALVSGSTRAEREKLLAAMGLDKFFNHIFAANSVGYQKKNIKFYESILKELKISGRQAAIIGDNYEDDISAGQLAIKTILLSRSGENILNGDYQYQPDYTINNLSAAVPILKLWLSQ